MVGLYTCLFAEAGYIMLRTRRENIASGRVSVSMESKVPVSLIANVAAGISDSDLSDVHRCHDPYLFVVFNTTGKIC